jgi:hypothetical protein
MILKTCTRCKQKKDTETQFHRNAWAKDGLHWYCKPCRSEHAFQKAGTVRKNFYKRSAPSEKETGQA